MNSDSWLNLFLSLHGLILFAAALSSTLRLATQKGWLKIKAREELWINHLLIICVFVLPMASLILANRFDFQPMARTYTTATFKEFDANIKIPSGEKLIVGSYQHPHVLSVQNIKLGALLFILLTMAVSFAQILKEAKYLRTLLNGSLRFRQRGKVLIVFSDRTTVPFSLRTLKQAWTVLPLEFATEPEKLKISIYHEFQHHRQGDTTWLFIFQCLRGVAGLNPALNVWLKIVSEVQELKVDENLVDQGKVEPREYARCLIEVAESVAKGERQLVCAAGLAFLPGRQLLKRRIESMFKEKRTQRIPSALVALVTGVLVFSSMTALALTTGKFIGARAITLAQAEDLAVAANKGGGFPVVVNDLVLEQLNRYIGTAQGREFIKNALARLENYRPMVEKVITSYGANVPAELIAMPITESGYQNLPQGRGPNLSAGLWQFIPSTARVYGLRVDASVDERLKEEQETDAAIRYLYSNQLRFRDWQLAVMAYNMGEKALEEAIVRVGSHDAWTLIRAGHEGDHGYLAKINAAILILKNPSLVE